MSWGADNVLHVGGDPTTSPVGSYPLPSLVPRCTLSVLDLHVAEGETARSTAAVVADIVVAEMLAAFAGCGLGCGQDQRYLRPIWAALPPWGVGGVGGRPSCVWRAKVSVCRPNPILGVFVSPG